MKKILLAGLIAFQMMMAPLAFAGSFTVSRIQIEGLQHISDSTVLTYLPIKPGQTLQTSQTSAIISALYKTGFFEKISLSRQGNTLIIHVIERQSIGELKITGNNLIATDKLTPVMKSMDIAEGRPYNPALIERIKQSLLNQYYELGRYNARIDVTATPMSRNRVQVKIDISEGLVAKISRISILGAKAFSESKLIDQLTLTKPGVLTFLTQTDQYSQEKLDESLDKLRNFYMDRGYLKFAIKSSQVSITPDRKSVYLTIVVDEGPVFTITGFALMGDTIVPKATLIPLVKIKSGDIFSKQVIMDSEKAMSEALGDQGYIYAQIGLNPNLNEARHTVFLTFDFKPGKRTYVRHIFFVDNTKTNDLTYRRELRQMEGAPISSKKLEESKHRLNLLPYIRNVDMSVEPVSGAENQVDVSYKMTEQSSAEISGRIGYSQLEHVILGAGINQKNFLGTGETLGLNFNRSRYLQQYDLSFTNPYYTPDGISRSVNLAISRYDSTDSNTSYYSTNEYDLSVMYGIPVRQFDSGINRMLLGYGYQNTLVNLQNLNSSYPPSTELIDFTNKHGRHFQQLVLTTGFTRDTRDKAIFPTSGMAQTLALNWYVPLAKESLHYYTVDYTNAWYQPLYGDFIFTTRGTLGYGNSFSGGARNFPFFRDYYAGGIGSVRGYEGNSLGPRDSNQKPTGGNFLADATLGLIFPNYLSENFRTTFFFDAGNVYKTYDNRSLGGTASGPLRFSLGLDGQWFVPFLGAPIEVSLAKAIHAQRSASNNGLRDSLEGFQFSLGANLG